MLYDFRIWLIVYKVIYTQQWPYEMRCQEKLQCIIIWTSDMRWKMFMNSLCGMRSRIQLDRSHLAPYNEWITVLVTAYKKCLKPMWHRTTITPHKKWCNTIAKSPYKRRYKWQLIRIRISPYGVRWYRWWLKPYDIRWTSKWHRLGCSPYDMRWRRVSLAPYVMRYWYKWYRWFLSPCKGGVRENCEQAKMRRRQHGQGLSRKL